MTKKIGAYVGTFNFGELMRDKPKEKKSDFEKWFKDWSILGKHCKKENKFVAISQLKTAGFTILSPAELAELLVDYNESIGYENRDFGIKKEYKLENIMIFLKKRGVGK